MSTGGSGTADASADDYVLSRNLAGRIRLNLQHFLFPKIFGYLLHPDIPRKENMAVADVATGSGVWMLDVASQLPESTRFHGFDISLDSCPPKAWLPPNIELSQFDLTADVPSQFEGAFDIINVRLLLVVVKKNDPSSIIRKLLSMLKPGGWLQWTEGHLSPDYTDFIKAETGLDGTAMTALDAQVKQGDGRLQPTWPATLDKYFEAEGFEDVQIDWRQPKDFLPWLAFTNDVVMATYGEIVDKVAESMPEDAKPKADGLRDLYARAVGEAGQGVAWKPPRLNVIGRKKL